MADPQYPLPAQHEKGPPADNGVKPTPNPFNTRRGVTDAESEAAAPKT